MIIHILRSEVRGAALQPRTARGTDRRQRRPDPDRDGFQPAGCRWARTHALLVQQLGGRPKAPPIIACTARVGAVSEARGASRVRTFLSKPFAPENLLTLVHQFVRPPMST